MVTTTIPDYERPLRHQWLTIAPRYGLNRSFLWSSAIFRSDVISNLKKCLLDPPSRPPCPSPQTFQSIFLYPQGKKSAISLDDRKRLDAANMLAIQPRMALYQEMIDHYSISSGKTGRSLRFPKCRYPFYCFISQSEVTCILYCHLRLITTLRPKTSHRLRGWLIVVWMLLLRNTVLKLTNKSMKIWPGLEKVTPPGFYSCICDVGWILFALQFCTNKHGNRQRHTRFPLAFHCFHWRLRKLRINGRSRPHWPKGPVSLTLF